MQTKIILEEFDRIEGTSFSLSVYADTGEDAVAAITFPLDPEVRLRLCDQIAEGLEDIRHAALSELAPKRS